MRATRWIGLACLLTIVFIAGGALAHESYDIGDGEYTITVGDQNEPMYTFKWSNLDLTIRDSDGNQVADAHEDLEAVLVGPGGEELDRPLATQHGAEGRYEFDQGHYYTQPGQYTLRLEGTINGVDATGEYDLPGPRQSYSQFGFPHDDVPTLLDLQQRLDTLEQDQSDEDLQQRVQDLEDQVDALEQRVQALEDGSGEETDANNAPGIGLVLATGALGTTALIARRHR